MLKILIAGEGKGMKHYINAVSSSGAEPVASLDVKSCDGFDALLLPGAFGDIDPALYGQENRGSLDVDRALDEAQLAITELFVRAGKPIFGICKGCQLLNVYFGGTLIQDLPDDTHRYTGCDNAHDVVNLPGTLLHGLYGDRCRVNSLHHQALDRVPECLKVVSRCPEDGVAEAFVHESLPIVAVQWHPERMAFEKRRQDCCSGEDLFAALKKYLLSL